MQSRKSTQTSGTAASRPSELAITLAVLPRRYSNPSGWMTADEVRGGLKLLGFECSSQFVAAALARMARTEAPWVERREDVWGGPWQYRITRFGRNDIDNRLPKLRVQA